MTSKYHLTAQDSSSYAGGYEIFLKRTNFREVILKGFSNRISNTKIISNPFSILDVGCGNGEMTEKYLNAITSSHNTPINLHLLEPSLTALEDASEKLIAPNIKTIKHNITLDDYLLSQVPNNFDLIIVSYVFYHLNAKSVQGLISLLKPNGNLVIMMGGKDHPLRRNPILKTLSKHGSSFDLKAELSSMKNIKMEVNEFTTDVDISGLICENQIIDDGRLFFSFIYNHDLDLFTQPQLAALHQTVSEILKSDDGKAHPKHEIIWVERT